VTISVAVMAHHKREAWVPELVDSIDADVEVVWDRHNERWETGRRALLAYDPAASHHLVVQDDAIVCRDLVAGLTVAVEHSQFHPVGLYIGTIRPARSDVVAAVRIAQLNRSSWVQMEGPWWGVGILVPTAHIEDIVEFGDRKTSVANYDMKISRWYKTQNIDCWYTFPSLVEHRHGDENPSLIPGRTAKNRRAHVFIGRDESALSVGWSHGDGTFRKGTGMVIYRHRRTGKEVYPAPGTVAEQRLAAKPQHWELVVPEPEVCDVDAKVAAAHIGAGWYETPDGGKVRGRTNAEAVYGGAA
jgi:hypothetical protein